MYESVLPHKKANQDWIRLDSETSGGTRKSFGFFKHQGRVSKVDADTRFESLKLALFALEAGKDPFAQKPTSCSAVRMCLVLDAGVDPNHKSGPKYLYICS